MDPLYCCSPAMMEDAYTVSEPPSALPRCFMRASIGITDPSLLRRVVTTLPWTVLKPASCICCVRTADCIAPASPLCVLRPVGDDSDGELEIDDCMRMTELEERGRAMADDRMLVRSTPPPVPESTGALGVVHEPRAGMPLVWSLSL